MLLADLVQASEAVGATRSRREKIAALAAALGRLDPHEAEAGIAFLSGELRQRQIGVGWASLRDLPAPAPHPTLAVGEVDGVFARVGTLSGPGSQGERRRLLAELLERATSAEQAWLARLLLGDLGQGALAGLMAEAVARAAGAPVAALRRAVMVHGNLAQVGAAALSSGPAALAAFRLEVGRPLQPMLASPSEGIEAALERIRPAAVEWKLDGARIQVHRSDADVAIFTRTLDDVTARLPEVVDAVRALPASAAILDGESIALRADGRPEPFQVTSSRLGRKEREGAAGLTPQFFDVLHVDGADLLDEPAERRSAILAGLVPEPLRVPRVVVEDATAGASVLADALARGHEGVVVKSLEAPYEAGRRGAAWLKVKPRHTLDLVVLAAEWGHGRRQGWLSNLHLGARDPAGGFVMLGKTFKGLTDALLAWQTDRLLALETGRTRGTVHVRPELVVEVAFDGVQSSSRYPGGVTLRFARVVRHRPDKPASEADELGAVLAVRAS